MGWDKDRSFFFLCLSYIHSFRNHENVYVEVLQKLSSHLEISSAMLPGLQLLARSDDPPIPQICKTYA
jgi:hypothetical protein